MGGLSNFSVFYFFFCTFRADSVPSQISAVFFVMDFALHVILTNNTIIIRLTVATKSIDPEIDRIKYTLLYFARTSNIPETVKLNRGEGGLIFFSFLSVRYIVK